MYDPLDTRGVPKSKGIPVLVQISAIIGILAIVATGEAVIANAGYGHHWPSLSTLRLPLK
jgi:hypothetical protein